MKIISFCLYGTAPLYYKGLIENIHIISKKLPDFFTYVYYGSDITEDKITNLRSLSDKIVLIATNKLGAGNMIDRLNPIKLDDTEIFFCRDADSRINDRDLWCINKFIESEKSVHCIRDSFWHKSKLMGGILGFKVKKIENLEKIREDLSKYYEYCENPEYGDDEHFLGNKIYPLIKNDLYLQTSITAFNGEEYNLIDYHNDGVNFVGNVIEFGDENKEVPKFNYYNFSVKDQVNWLISQKQFQLASHIGKTVRWDIETGTIDALFIANYYADDLEECRRLMSMYEYSSITDHVVDNCNFMFTMLKKHGYKIIGTTNLSDEPKYNEIMIYYGTFPVTHLYFPITNKVYRNAGHFNKVTHDIVKYDDCWNNLDKIYILNLEEREDRYIETMCELCKVDAPLNKVFHYKAKKTPGDGGPYVGATQNHIDVMNDIVNEGYINSLILEDDIVFSPNISQIKKDITEFFDSDYLYDICFLSASRFHKKEPHNDLLIKSKQICTTSSAYFLSNKTIQSVRDCVMEGMDLLKKTNNANLYCIDRYWSKLQEDDRVFIFKRKMAYQRPNYSNIKGTIAAYLD